MKKNATLRVIATLMLAGIFTGASGQQFIKSLTVKDTAEINLQARKTIGNLAVALNSLADPEVGESEREQIMESYFSTGRIFINKNISVEDDLDPSIHASGEAPTKIEDYLKSISMYYTPGGDESISFTINEISPIIAGDYLRLKVFYSELFKGTTKATKDKPGVPFTKNYRLAELFVYKSAGRWVTYINKLSFDNGKGAIDPSLTYVTISGKEPEPEPIAKKDESYYKLVFEKGNKAMASNNFAEAYIAFRELAVSKELGKYATTKMVELRNKVKSSGTFEVDSLLHKVVLAKAEKLEERYRYADAKTAYEYALELNLIDKSIPQKIQTLTARVNKERNLNGLYEKRVYEDALLGYTEAISDDNRNPYLLLGRARCNWQLQKEKQAESDFEKAIGLDKSNPDAYIYQGDYYQHRRKPDYEKAYNSFANYVNVSDNSFDNNYAVAYSQMAMCKGMIAFNKNSVSEALDSFGSAYTYYPSNTEALVCKAICYNRQSNYVKASESIEQALKMNDKNAEAHYWAGKIKLTNPDNKRNYTEEAMAEYKTALGYNDNLTACNYDLADLLQRSGKWSDAIPYLTKCITADSTYATAYWKRGLSYYHVEKYQDAFQDYARYAKKDLFNMSFYVDYGNLFLMSQKADDAITWYNKAINSSEACLGYGLALYVKQPGDPEKKYLQWIEKAFAKGINPDVVNNNVIIKKLKNDDKDYKELLKKYKNYK